MDDVKSNYSEFGDLENNREILFILLYGLFVTFSYAFLPARFTRIMLVIVLSVLALLNPTLCLSASITSSIYMSELLTGAYLAAISSMLLVGLYFRKIRIFHELKAWKILLGGLFFVFESYFVGIKSSPTIAILMVLGLLRVVYILNTDEADNILIVLFGYFGCAISIAGYFGIGVIKGWSMTTYGRLSFSGDIKTVAIAVAIPLLIILCSRIKGNSVFGNIRNGFLDLCLLSIFSLIVILTGARGVLLGIGVSLLVYSVLNRGNSKILKIAVVIILVIIAINFLSQFSQFRIERLWATDEFASGNGRTNIWKMYWEYLNSSGLQHVILGIGPGDLRRLGVTGAYAHSTFFDVLMSYGIVGFCFMVAIELRMIYQLIREKCDVAVAVNIMLIVIYAFHGSAVNTNFYTIQAVLYILCMNTEKFLE